MRIFTRIKNALTLLVFFFLLTTAFSPQAFATHMAGGDIEYQNVGPRRWKIKLTVYRFCDNGAAWLCSSFSCPQTITATPSPTIAQGGLNPNNCAANPSSVSTTLQLISVVDAEKDRMERCGAMAKNSCDNLGQSTPGSYKPSVEKYIFEGELNMNLPSLSSATTCPYWDIGWSYCCRNSTVNVQNQPQFYIQATLNIFDGQGVQNNSPVFKNDAIIVFCAAQEYVFNMGTLDPDQDSLTYRICKSLQAANTPVPYNSPFNERVPFPLISTAPPHNNYPGAPFVVIDSTSGDVSLNANNPTNSPIGGDISIEVTQWRYKEFPVGAGIKVPYISGISMRNLQIYSIPCLGNNPPKLFTNPALPNGNAKTNWEVCAGQQLCFTITAKDTDFRPNSMPPRIDSTFLSWDTSIVRPGKITFGPDYTAGNKPREDRWKFCWQTELSDTATIPYYFTVKGMDNMCPNPGKTIRSFGIKVSKGNLQADLVKQKTGCNTWELKVRKTIVTQTFSTALLEIANQPDNFSFSGGTRISYSANPNPSGSGNTPRVIIHDSVQFNQPGTYYIRYTVTAANSCPYTIYDSIVVGSVSNLSVVVNDTTKCKATAINLTAQVNGGTPPFTYSWYRNSMNSQPLNVQSSANQFTANDTINTKYFIVVKDSNQCVASDSMQLVVKKINAGTILVNDSSQCIGLNSFAFSHTPLTGFSNYTLRWISEQSSGTDSVWNKSYSTTGPKQVKLIINEASGCSDTLSRMVNVWPIPSVSNVIRVNDSIQCVRGNQFTFSYIALPELSYKWKYNDTVVTDISLTRKYTTVGAHTVQLIVGDSGCQDTAVRTVQVTAIPQAGSIIVDDSLQCITGNAFKFSYARVPGLTYTWLHDFNMTPDSLLKKTYTTAGIKTVKLIVSREGCSDTATQQVSVMSKPVVTNIISVNKNTQCINNNNFVFTHSNANDPLVYKHLWVNGDSLVLAPSFTLTYPTSGLKKIKLLVTQPGACMDTASIQVSVTSIPSGFNTIRVNDSIQCVSNNQFKLSYSKTAGPDYKWIYNNTTSTDSVIWVNYTSTGSYSVRLMVGLPGCSDTATQKLQVTSVPVAGNDIIIDDAEQCAKGNKFRLSYLKKPLTDYKWVYNATTSKDSVIFLTYADTGIKTVKLMLGEPGCSDTAEQQITVWPQPVTKNVLSVNDSIQCLNGNNFLLTYNTANNPYHHTNKWVYETQTSTDDQVSVIYQDAGVKQVKLMLTTVNGCADTLLKNLTVKPSPLPLIQGKQTNILLDEELDYSIVAQTNSRYKWSVLNGQFTGADTTPIVRVKWNVLGEGKLKVEQSLDECTTSDSIEVEIGTSGLRETGNIETLDISPNPNNGLFTIKLSSKIKSSAVIKLYNTIGAAVVVQQADFVPGANEVKMHCELPAGIYLLMIEEQGGLITRKVMIK